MEEVARLYIPSNFRASPDVARSAVSKAVHLLAKRGYTDEQELKQIAREHKTAARKERSRLEKMHAQYDPNDRKDTDFGELNIGEYVSHLRDILGIAWKSITKELNHKWKTKRSTDYYKSIFYNNYKSQ